MKKQYSSGETKPQLQQAREREKTPGITKQPNSADLGNKTNGFDAYVPSQKP